MSVQTLYTAATGMQALETKLDVIANNLANINTTGFKKGRANFEDLVYLDEVLPGAEDANGELTPTGVQVGLGTKVSSIQTNFGQGPLTTTDNPFDVAITGQGFFQVLDTDAPGGFLYTRAGNLSVNANGDLVLGSSTNGRLLSPQITVPPDARFVTIGADGTVSVTQSDGTTSALGNLQLALFVNPEGLEKRGENLFAETPASATAQLVTPGTEGAGDLRQGMLETSNVEPVRELIDLITTQRAFELNSQAVQAGDEIMQLVNNLRRF